MIINPENVPSRTTTAYPKEFHHLIQGRIKKALGNAAGIKNFGVNLVTLAPGSCSALRHWHSHQDEFIYIIEGEATLITNSGEQTLQAGIMAGFPAGEEDGHHLVNKSSAPVIYLEIGDRTPDDVVNYPDDDLVAKATPNGWALMRKDGSAYS
jgi:uncharacterized cupin superfamily protein